MATRQLQIDIIVNADNSITKLDTLDEKMRVLSDRSLVKISNGVSTVDQELKKLQQTMDRSADATNRSADATNRNVRSHDSLATAAQKLAGIIGVTLTAGAVVGAVKSTLAYADALDTAAQRTGINVVAYQKLAYAAKQNNVEIGGLTNAINMLQDRVAGGDKSAVAAVQNLGLSWEKVRSADALGLILSISDGVRGMTSHNDQVKAMNDLFGKQGKELLPLISGNMRDVMDAAHVMTESTVKDLADTNDALDDIQNSLRSILGSLVSMTGVTWVIKVAAQDLRGADPATYFSQLFNTISQLSSIGLFAYTGGVAGQATWNPALYQHASKGPGRGDIDLPAEPQQFLEDSPWGGLSVGEWMAQQKHASKSKLLPGTQWPWPSYGAPGTVTGRTGAYDYSFWNTRTTTNTDFFGPGSSLSDVAMRAGMLGGPANVEGRGPFSGAPTTAVPGIWSNFGSSFTSGLPNIILSAITGGGNIGGAVGALGGSTLGSSLVKKIFGDSPTSGIGKMLGGLIPGLGGIAGSLLGPLFGKLFGPSQGKIEGQKADSQIGDLQKGLTDLYGSFQNVDELGKLVGVDIGSAWGDKNVAGLKHFTQATKDFNAALAEKNQRFQSVIANGGVASNSLMAVMGAQAQAGGQVGDQARQALGQFLTSNVNNAASGLQQVAGSGMTFTAGGASAIGAGTMALVGQMQSMGMSMNDILAALGPTIQSLQKQFQNLGVDGGAAFADLNAQVSFLADDTVKKTVTGIDGLTQLMVGLGNTGNLTEDTFKGLTGQIGESYNKMIAQGKDGDRALKAIQPDLQRMWELEQKFGFKADEATQKLIDQGVKSGIVGEDFESDTDKMKDAIDKLIAKMGEFIDKILGVPGAVSAANNNMPTLTVPTNFPNPLDPNGPQQHGGNAPDGGLPHVGPRPPGFVGDWPPPGTQLSTGGYITPYGVQHFSLGMSSGLDTVNAKPAVGEVVLPSPLVSAAGGPQGVINRLRGGGGGGSVNVTFNVQAYDGSDVMRMVRSGAFKKELARQLPYLFTDNIEGVRSNSLRALGVTNQ
jgi:hypothetical protein